MWVESVEKNGGLFLWWMISHHWVGDTVDSRNPAPVDMLNIPFCTGLYTSQVVQDFFYQQ